jgi:hypothetical protein
MKNEGMITYKDDVVPSITKLSTVDGEREWIVVFCFFFFFFTL